jgi:hypothetical protein
MIIASAVKLPDGQVFIGKRHADAYRLAQDLLKSGKPFCGEDGFLTSNLVFLDRKEAYTYAKKTGQFNRRDTGYHGKDLFLEDLRL